MGPTTHVMHVIYPLPLGHFESWTIFKDFISKVDPNLGLVQFFCIMWMCNCDLKCFVFSLISLHFKIKPI
ncbi:putative Mago nashi protein [Helianthus anomalus]